MNLTSQFKTKILILLLLSSSTLIHAQFMRSLICIDLNDLETGLEILPQPVGCEVVDCCQGCPGPGILETEIRFLSNADVALDLSDSKIFPSNKAEFDRRMDAKSNPIFFKTKYSIKDISNVIKPKLIFQNQMKKNLEKNTSLKLKEGHYAEIEIIQRQNNLIVNRYRHLLQFHLCLPRFNPTSDVINLMDNTSNDVAGIMIDGKRQSGCSNDRLFFGDGSVEVWNFRESEDCHNEVIVFSDDNALSHTTAVDWTNGRDEVDVNLAPRIQATLNVWILEDGIEESTDLQVLAEANVQRADQLLNENHCGINVFSKVRYITITDDEIISDVIDALDRDSGRCTNFSSVRNEHDEIYDEEVINVYYINFDIPSANAIACRSTNTILMGSGFTPETLSHELGHIFSLRHIYPEERNEDFQIDTDEDGAMDGLDYNGDGEIDFDDTNLMYRGVLGRTEFTEGQAFRMNFNINSDLNRLEFRDGDSRTCSDETISDQCPWLGLRLNN